MRTPQTGLGSVLTIIALTTAALALPASADENHAVRHGSRPSDRPDINGQIVFRRYFDAAQTRGALFVVDPDGTDVRQVTFPPKEWRDNVPAWSPDGSKIVFERFKRDESTSRILVIDPDTGDKRVVVPCKRPRCAYAIDPWFSPDGRSIAYARTVAPPTDRPPEWQLYTAIFMVGVDGSDSRQVTATPRRRKGTFAPESTDPTISPDGRLLAFIRTRHDPTDQGAVFVQPMGSPGEARRITPWRRNCEDRPTFSPDGRLMLFRCHPRGEEGPSNLYLVRPDGSDLRRLTRPSADRQYLGSSFSPGFRRGHGWITAGRTGGVGGEGNADVFALLVRGGDVVRRVNLTRSEEWDSGPNWGTHPTSG